jgi:DNA-binding NarL/FixJ family response regulator
VPAGPIASLSEREFEVLHLIGLGFSTREIAAKLNRSVKTIEAHRANIKEKLNIRSGNELMRFAIQWIESQ